MINKIIKNPFFILVIGIIITIIGFLHLYHDISAEIEETCFNEASVEIESTITKIKTYETLSKENTETLYEFHVSYEYEGLTYQSKVTYIGNDAEILESGDILYIYIDSGNPSDCRLNKNIKSRTKKYLIGSAVMISGLCLLIFSIFIFIRNNKLKKLLRENQRKYIEEKIKNSYIQDAVTLYTDENKNRRDETI